MEPTRCVYSCVVDASPIFYLQTWGWVHSLIHLAGVAPDRIFVNHTDNVEVYFLEEIRPTGVHLHPIERFGDGKFCNKVAQLRRPEFREATSVCLMDTDMIVMADLADLTMPGAIAGKRVDLPNPDLAVLTQLFQEAGFQTLPATVPVDCGDGQTFYGNFNGGLYLIPGELVKVISASWEKWALWILHRLEVLTSVRKQNHVDQIAFCMAVHEHSIPLRELERRYNFPLHLPIEKVGAPVVLHYHRKLTKLGMLESGDGGGADFQETIGSANALLGRCFNNRIFWSFRYAAFPELGSGVGSRNQNLLYKRELLQQLEVEASASVLDLGCGDLEVLRQFQFSHYTGVDPSPEAIAIARQKRPDWHFILMRGLDDESIPECDTVLCFEVLIHQTRPADYFGLVKLLTRKTRRRLIVSGYEQKQVHHGKNHMVHFYEPLSQTLEAEGKFSKIRKIGAHSDVAIFLAEIDSQGEAS